MSSSSSENLNRRRKIPGVRRLQACSTPVERTTKSFIINSTISDVKTNSSSSARTRGVSINVIRKRKLGNKRKKRKLRKLLIQRRKEEIDSDSNWETESQESISKLSKSISSDKFGRLFASLQDSGPNNLDQSLEETRDIGFHGRDDYEDDSFILALRPRRRFPMEGLFMEKDSEILPLYNIPSIKSREDPDEGRVSDVESPAELHIRQENIRKVYPPPNKIKQREVNENIKAEIRKRHIKPINYKLFKCRFNNDTSNMLWQSFLDQAKEKERIWLAGSSTASSRGRKFFQHGLRKEIRSSVTSTGYENRDVNGRKEEEIPKRRKPKTEGGVLRGHMYRKNGKYISIMDEISS